MIDVEVELKGGIYNDCQIPDIIESLNLYLIKKIQSIDSQLVYGRL